MPPGVVSATWSGSLGCQLESPHLYPISHFPVKGGASKDWPKCTCLLSPWEQRWFQNGSDTCFHGYTVTGEYLGSQKAGAGETLRGPLAPQVRSQDGLYLGRSVEWLRWAPEAPTFSEEHFWCNVIWGPNQGMRQTPLMLLPGSLLQGLQPVSTMTIRHIIPEVARLHAVLSDVVPFFTQE